MKINISLYEFVIFLKNPNLKNKKYFFFKKLSLFFIVAIAMFFSVFVTNFLIKMIVYFIDFDEGKKIFNYQINKWNKYSVLENIAYILFLGPLIEELISRLYLDLKKINLQITMISILLLILKFNDFNLDLTSFLYLIVIGVLFSILSLIKQKKINNFGLKYYGYIFYLSSISFSLLHISNFTSVLNHNFLWLLPLLILPQLIMGVFFGYIRIKLGFFWGFLLHICMNLPAVLIYLLNKIS